MCTSELRLNLCLIYGQSLFPPLIRQDTTCGVWSCLTLCKLCSINSICLKCVMLLWWLLPAYLNVMILVLCEDVQRFYFRGHPIHQLLFLLQLKHISVSGGRYSLMMGLLTLGFIRPSSEVLIYKDTLCEKALTSRSKIQKAIFENCRHHIIVILRPILIKIAFKSFGTKLR